MLPAEGWAPRFSAPRHAATPANKSRAEPWIDSAWRQCEWKNRSINGNRLEVTVQSDLGHQLSCTPSTSYVKERSAAPETGDAPSSKILVRPRKPLPHGRGSDQSPAREGGVA